MNRPHRYLTMIFVFTILLAACGSQASPEQIATYPKITPIAQYPPQMVIAYRAYIELKVSNVDKAAERAASLCYSYGGFLSSSNSWYVEGLKATTLELAVPTANFDRLHKALLELGDLVNESLTGELVEPRYREPGMDYSYITLQLRPNSRWTPPFIIGRWDPLQTLQSAFSVFVTIFGFLANIIIWVVVVAGPFALLAVLVRWLVLRLRRAP